MHPIRVSGLLFTIALAAGCGSPAPTPAPDASAAVPSAVVSTPVTRTSYGTLPDGTTVDLFTFSNAHGIEVRAITYGGIIVSLKTPDRAGTLDDIVLGFDAIDGYLTNPQYFGAIIGRFGNRLANGRFVVDGRAYSVPKNNGPNALHGGPKGFHTRVWKGEPFNDARGNGVVFTYTSRDGEEGFPGTLQAKVTYLLTADDRLSFTYEATTDAPTPVNLTQHSYFNLGGQVDHDILDHVVEIPGAHYTPVDKDMIPTGEIATVSGTPFDFRTPTAIGARIDETHPQLVLGRGYDHNYVIDGAGERVATRVTDPKSGRTLEVRTTEPGVQFYSGNFLDGTLKGKHGIVYKTRTGFCLETQHYPDSPNQPSFPDTILRPGTTLHSTTTLVFGVAR